MIRAGIYNRCSTEEEAQMNALGIQACESREIVQSKGWSIAAQYIETQSGTTVFKRTQYQRLLDDMETDLFDVVVIKSIDRLTRCAKDWYLFTEKLARYGKRLYIYIDHRFYTPDDSLLTGVKAILAEDFSRELSKKIKNAHKRRQEKQSGLNITVPIFGWDKIGKDAYVLNKEEADAYRLAFALAEEGKGFYTIEKMMYENGARSKRGTRIAGVQWRKMLYSPRAHGTVVLHQTEYDFEAKKTVKLPEREWIYIENALPPIVSEEYQKRVVRILEKRAGEAKQMKTAPSRGASRSYILSGKIYCSCCGAKYYHTTMKTAGGSVVEWKCSTALKNGRKTPENREGCNGSNVKEDMVLKIMEESCREQYERLFGNHENIPDEVMGMMQKILEGQNPKQELLQLKKETEKCQRKQKVLLDKLTDGIIGDIEFGMMNRELCDKMEELRKKVSNINDRKAEYYNNRDRMSEIEKALQYDVMKLARVREMITRVEKIVVCPDKLLEVHFYKHL